MKTKKQRGLEMTSNVVSLLQCPHCGQPMTQTQEGIQCPSLHTFDLSKQGYLHLAGQVSKSRYTKELFTARQALLGQTGFFEPLIRQIAEGLAEHLNGEKPLILDMGCGEGTHLAGIVNQLGTASGIGIDLAKEGIQLATNHQADILWLVADLAKSPIQNHVTDVVLNILSPANHQEFQRVLKPGGLVVKVVPNSGYLHELRSYFYAGTEKETFENEEAETRFTNELNNLGVQKVNYTKQLTEQQLRDLIAMTPLTWNAAPQQVEEFIQTGQRTITIDLKILYGQTKK